jgi:hypothetical protein
MRDGAGAARSASVWLDLSRPLALPPVELVLLGGAMPALVDHGELSEALAQEGLLAEAGIAGAALAAPCPAALRARLGEQARTGLAALDDESWRD